MTNIYLPLIDLFHFKTLKMTAKSLFLCLWACGLSLQLLAQTEKAKAKSDGDILDPEKAAKASTWVSRGNIYSDLALNPNNYDKYKEAAYEAHQAYMKALSMESNNAAAQEGLRYLAPVLINVGATAYSKNEKNEAMRAFVLANDLNPTDSVSLEYAIMTAFEVKDYEMFKKMTHKLLELPLERKLQFYTSLATHYALVEENYGKAREVLERGLVDYPKSKNLRELKIALDIKEDKLAAAIPDLERKIAEDPNNFDGYYDLGVVYESYGKYYFNQLLDSTVQLIEPQRLDYEAKMYDNFGKATELYLKSLSLEGESTNTIFNTATVYFNRGVYLKKQLNKLAYKDLKSKEGKAIDEQLDNYFKDARPYFEKLANTPIDKKYRKADKTVVFESLRIILKKLDNKDDHAQRIDVLKKLLGRYEDYDYVSDDKEEKMESVRKELEELEASAQAKPNKEKEKKKEPEKKEAKKEKDPGVKN
ncbi:MAG TPA: hypothetical protein DCM08_02745 [Microscillaceae bacterium]|jgi:tetratricopeptide (TPR) repeat protein|nr:hypothetical protein [Microscillaceae bacterium]